MKLEYNAKKLLIDAFAPQAGERVWFINDLPGKGATEEDKDRARMIAEWYRIMKKLGRELLLDVKDIVVLGGPNDWKKPAKQGGKKVDALKLLKSWGEKDIIVAVTGVSVTFHLITRLEKQKFRFGSAPGVTSDFEGFKADYSLIPLRFNILTRKMGKAESAEMTFRLEDFIWKCSFDLRGERFIFNENGEAHRPGDFLNLPSGCANVAPYAGIKGDPRGKSRTTGFIPAIVDDELIVYEIKGNRIVKIHGFDGEEAAEKERKAIFGSGGKDMAVITKLGLGVNDEARCNGTHVGDEKTMGMHWGYGPKKHFPDTIWAEHPIDMDIDFVYPDGTIEPIFRNSYYTQNLGELFA